MSAGIAKTTITDKSAFAQFRRNWSSRIKAAAIDQRNRQEYGPDAPLFAERLWIPVPRVKHSLKQWNPRESARVIVDWPQDKLRPLDQSPSIRCCLQHWVDGFSWEQTGIYDQMLIAIKKRGKVDGLRSLDDVEKRYQELDRLFTQVKASGELSPRSDFVPGNFREEGGPLFHVGPNGQPIFGGKGHHRVAIALALKHKYMPAQLGCVSVHGLGYLSELRVKVEFSHHTPQQRVVESA